MLFSGYHLYKLFTLSLSVFRSDPSIGFHHLIPLHMTIFTVLFFLLLPLISLHPVSSNFFSPWLDVHLVFPFRTPSAGQTISLIFLIIQFALLVRSPLQPVPFHPIIIFLVHSFPVHPVLVLFTHPSVHPYFSSSILQFTHPPFHIVPACLSRSPSYIIDANDDCKPLH